MLGHLKREGSGHKAATPALVVSWHSGPHHQGCCHSFCLSLRPPAQTQPLWFPKHARSFIPVPRTCRWLALLQGSRGGQVGKHHLGDFQHVKLDALCGCMNSEKFSFPDRRIFLGPVHILAYIKVLQNRWSSWKDLKKFRQLRQAMLKMNCFHTKPCSWC